jgi:DNA topoisomerase-1
VEIAARQLGNTAAVCKKCYIHPAILDAYMDGRLHALPRQRSDESVVLALLERQLKRDAEMARRRGAGARSLAPILAQSISRLSKKRAQAAAASMA